MGPEGGNGGGPVIAEGTPEDVAAVGEPHRPVPRADPRAQRAHTGTADGGQPDAGPGRRGGHDVGDGPEVAGQEVAGQGGGQDAGDQGLRQGCRGDHRGQEADGTGLDDQGGGAAEDRGEVAEAVVLTWHPR